jgi:hypothetical protein
MSRSYWRWIAFAVIVFSGLAVLRIWDPAVNGFYPSCPLRSTTGILCPGCGSTRAMSRLVHGDVPAAFDMNPLLVISIPFLIGMLCYPRITRWRYLPWVVLVILIAYAVLRNLPLEAFDVLRP